jgi:hypothetical protein
LSSFQVCSLWHLGRVNSHKPIVQWKAAPVRDVVSWFILLFH